MLVTMIGILILGGGLIATVLFLLPALGVDPNRGYSFKSQPLLTAGVACSALLFIVLLSYVAGIVAALVASRFFGWAVARSGFLWFVSLPGLGGMNARLFDWLFRQRT